MAVLGLKDGLHHPLVRMSNTVIQGGTHKDLDELIEDIDFGIYMRVEVEVDRLTQDVVHSNLLLKKHGLLKMEVWQDL